MIERKPVHILYMEDDEGLSVLFKKRMERLGYIVDQAFSGEEGITKFDPATHDVIVIDYNMGAMSGVDTITALKKRGELPPTIMLTGVGSEKVAVEALKVGASDYIVKDVEQGYFELMPSIIESSLFKQKLMLKNQEQQRQLEYYAKQLEYYAEKLEERNRELEKLAHFDNLTNLANRASFYEHVIRTIASSRRNEEMMAVMYVDLDKFKPINDAYGHTAGDALLCAVADRLKKTLRESDVIARLGGDEFAILIERVKYVEDCAVVAGKIIDALVEPFHLGAGVTAYVSASVGIATYPASGTTAEALTNAADAAMYKAKHEGRNRYVFHSQDIDNDVSLKLRVSLDLERALSENQFVLFYQPQYNAQTLELCGAEALIRWQHPEKGLIFPGDFIGIAEKTGFIVPIGEWVMAQACQQTVRWREKGIDVSPVAVNLSVKQFRQKGLPEMIAGILSRYGVDGSHLSVELTESTLVDDFDRCGNILSSMRDLGIDVSIDDFGIGYSSLTYLKTLPLSTLKIDKIFVDDIAKSERDKELVRSIIDLGHNLKLKVIAEGVEDKAQYEILKALGCDMVQGYYFGKPMPADKFVEWVGRQQPAA